MLFLVFIIQISVTRVKSLASLSSDRWSLVMVYYVRVLLVLLLLKERVLFFL